MTLEAKARLLIDQKLEAAGWVVEDQKDLRLGAEQGIAVREYPTDTVPADYLLFEDRQPMGVIEAKRDGAGHHRTRSKTCGTKRSRPNLSTAFLWT